MAITRSSSCIFEEIGQPIVTLNYCVHWGLPSDIFKLVIGNMEPKEISMISSVSKYWKYTCLKVVKEQEACYLKNLGDSVKENYSHVAYQLLNFKNSERFFSSNSLFNLRALIDVVYSNALSELEGISEEALKSLELRLACCKTSQFFEGGMDLLRLQQNFAKTTKVFSNLHVLSSILEGFVKISAMDHAFLVFNTMQDIKNKSKTSVSKNYYDSGLLVLLDKVIKNKALAHVNEIVNLMEHQSSKATAIAKCFVYGEIETGMAIAETLELGDQKQIVFDAIPFMKVISQGDYSHVFELDHLIISIETDFVFEFLTESIRFSSKKGMLQHVKDQLVAVNLTKKPLFHHRITIRSVALVTLAVELIKWDKFEDANKIIQILEDIPHIVDPSLILEIIMAFCLKDKIQEARDTVALFKLSYESLDNVNLLFEKIILIYERADILNEEDLKLLIMNKDETFYYISEKKKKTGKLDQAVELALKIDNLEIKNKVLRIIKGS